MKRCIIFAGGNPEPMLPDGINTENSLIIAADKGYINCKELGFTPTLTIGDFDSLGFIPNDCEKISFPKEKDDTDLMLAVREALKRECSDITILGALGGRLDHTLANIQTLAFIRENGAWGRILSCNEQIILVSSGKYTIKRKEHYSLSLFSYSREVTGLTVKGVKYPLNNGKIDSSFPIGVSNEIINDSAEISFSSGLLVIVQSRA
ncbi:MAG: thiamine diphosphokinase [Ruminococcus sp.]|nr:thiamine diphosphokinase [Ruminococcus sp.]